MFYYQALQGSGGSMSSVVGLPNNSYKPITNKVWISVRLCKSEKGCTRLAAASDKAYQLVAYGRWFSPGTPASSTTINGRHYIAEILLKVALNTINQIKHWLNGNTLGLYIVDVISFSGTYMFGNWIGVFCRKTILYWLIYVVQLNVLLTFNVWGILSF